MYFMSDFCHVCLQGEKRLTDIMKQKEAPHSLYNKLKLCVSEIDWCIYKTMFMCEKCVTMLNTAFEFKCQCIKSTEIFKNFLNKLGIEEHRIDVKRNETSTTIVEENSKLSNDKSELKPASFVHVSPDQQLFTPGQHLQNVIVSPNATQSAFPNLFFNLIPTNLLKPSSNPPPLTSVSRPPLSKTIPQGKDANQNMFVNINNTLHRIFPVISPTKDNSIVQSSTNHSVVPSILTNNIQPEITKATVKAKEVSHILSERNSEELSVEIDPSCFDLEEGSPDSVNTSDMNILRDWEDVIVSNKISSERDNINIRTSLNNSLPTLNKMLEVNNGLTPLDMGNVHKGSNIHNSQSTSATVASKQQLLTGNYVPICPKLPEHLASMDFEDKIEFFNAGHFMTQKEPEKSSAIDCLRIFSCEMCSNTFDSLQKLNSHIKQHHSGKFPYRCKYCFVEFAVRSQFKEHLHAHLSESGDNYTKDTITLDDLNSEHHESLILSCINYKPSPQQKTEQTEGEGEVETGEFKCEQCPRRFNSLHGLSRHKVRKHNFKAKKKYFIKGMKNARCDICNREFSTQSYLQLHIKLHYRKSDFRRKVFCKESYTSDSNFLNFNDKNQYEEYSMIDNHMLDVDIHMDTDESFSLDANVGETFTEGSCVSSKNVKETPDMDTSLSTCNTTAETTQIENSSENFAIDSSSTETVDSCLDDSTNADLLGSCDNTNRSTLLKLDLNDIADDKIKDKKEENKEQRIGKFNNEVEQNRSGTENKSNIENESKEINETVSELIDILENNDVSNVSNKDEKVEAKVCLSMEILADKNVEPKKQKCEFPVLQENEKKENCDPQPLKDFKVSGDSKKNSIRNDDVTVSNVGIKLKINLRNIKQNSREETVEKNREDFVKEARQGELVAPKQQKHIEDPPANAIDSKKCKEKTRKSGNSRTFSRKRKGGSSKKSSKKKSKASKVNEPVTDLTPTLEEISVAEEVNATHLKSLENKKLMCGITLSNDAPPTDNVTSPADNVMPIENEILKDNATPIENVMPANSVIPADVTLSADDTIMNDTENENQTFFSGYKIEMVNGRPKCNFCNKLFSRKHDLKRHMNNIHLKAIKYKCHLCDVTFYEAFHLTRHLRQHNCFLTCAVCPKNFSALRDLKCHVDSIHKEDSSVQCGTCSIVFANLDELKDHIQQHDREVIYKCHLCTDEFCESRELTKHLVGHSGMYSCGTCQATFATEHELNLHLKVHSLNVSEDTKYECEVCHNKYKKKRYLANHMKHSKHNRSLEKKDADEVYVNRVERNNSDDST